MLHGPAKRRQMARSILPSRARKQARTSLRLIHRRYRRCVAEQLRADVRVIGADPDDLFDLGTRTRFPNREIREVVIERRYADTLNHFERWAVATTRQVPIGARLSRLRSSLPEGLIGAHAESYLYRLPEIRPPQEHDWPYRYRPRPSPIHAERATTEAALRRALEVGLHAELNRQLRYAYSERLLLGLHDVGDFVASVVRCSCSTYRPYCEHPPLDAVRQFIERFGLA